MRLSKVRQKFLGINGCSSHCPPLIHENKSRLKDSFLLTSFAFQTRLNLWSEYQTHYLYCNVHVVSAENKTNRKLCSMTLIIDKD